MGNSFVLFGPDHLITLILVALASTLAFRAGGHARWSNPVNRAAGTLFAALALTLWGLRLRDGFQLDQDLPLALCDVAFLLCALCFFRAGENALILVAYWGLAGTLQALVTPDLRQAFPAPEFLLFFVGHSLIVVAVFFLLGRHRPARAARLDGATVAFTGLLAYTALVGSLDLLTGWNYGYLLAKPAGASLLDHLGPWPYYVAAGLGLGAILFAAVAGLLKLLWNLFPDERGEGRNP